MAFKNNRCPGPNRRDFLQFGVLGAMSLSGLLQSRSAGATSGNSYFGSAKRCIILFMSGGPPQQDTFDLKPDAPVDLRGEFKPLRTNVPGIEISEQFPLLAKMADRYAIIRSVTHDSNIHTVGAHAMLTGNAYPKPASGEIAASPDDFPQYGAVLSYLKYGGPALPTFVALPQRNTNTDGTIWPGQGGGFLGARFNPLQITADYPKHHSDLASYTNRPFRTPALTLPEGMTEDRFDARRRLLDLLEADARAAEHMAAHGPADPFRAQAFSLLHSAETQRAFNLDSEPAAVRDRYGRHLFGQGCLLSRRLVAAGVPLVTLYWHPDGNTTAPSWDTHEKNYENLRGHLMSPCDQGFSALLEDLHQSGLLKDTMVVWMGEFGRTPQINKAGGRDHWGACQSIVMAGAAIRGGQVYGKSDKIAAYPVENPVSPGDVGATIYSLLGVHPDTQTVDQTGRPHRLVQGEPITGIM